MDTRSIICITDKYEDDLIYFVKIVAVATKIFGRLDHLSSCYDYHFREVLIPDLCQINAKLPSG